MGDVGLQTANYGHKMPQGLKIVEEGRFASDGHGNRMDPLTFGGFL